MFRITQAVLLSLLALSRAAEGALPEDGICRAKCSVETSLRSSSGEEEICQFTVKVDLFASERGYFEFEECSGTVNPTLGIEIGKTYRFVQYDKTNYFHPLGFAYHPDGAHVDADELEPGVAPPRSVSNCAEEMRCPAPMYFRKNEYLGNYSNINSIANITTGEEYFGLDDYEPLFFHPLPDWLSYGPFSVYLNFDVNDYLGDIFYFCHIHSEMSGRIKLLKNDVPVSPGIDLPDLGDTYPFFWPSEYDKQCGTFGLDAFQLPHPQCPERFVCYDESENISPTLSLFSNCLDAMNCAMMAGMTTGIKAKSEIALFIHQMIPHHQNAVNMAKALLKTGAIKCDDITEESDDCTMEVILREIVNGQNAQINAMRIILANKEWPQTDDCVVEVSGFHTEEVVFNSSVPGEEASSSSTLGIAMGGYFVTTIVAMALLV